MPPRITSSHFSIIIAMQTEGGGKDTHEYNRGDDIHNIDAHREQKEWKYEGNAMLSNEP